MIASFRCSPFLLALPLVVAASCSKGEPASQSVAKRPEAAVAADKAQEGCLHAKQHACAEPKPGGSSARGHLGAPFEIASVQPLSKALDSHGDGESIRVSGTVSAVCKKRGCWLVLKDEQRQARVMVKGGVFAFPFGARGKKAVVEGDLRLRELSTANVAHLKKDGDDSIVGDGARKEYFIYASAAQIH